MHPILGLRIFEGSHLPIKIRTMGPEYNRWQGIPAVLQYEFASPARAMTYVWLFIY